MSSQADDTRAWREPLSAIAHGKSRISVVYVHPPYVCTCRVAQRQQMYFWLLSPLKKIHLRGFVIMNMVSAVSAAQTTCASSCEDEELRDGHKPVKVRTLLRPSATPDGLLARLPPWLSRAARVL